MVWRHCAADTLLGCLVFRQPLRLGKSVIGPEVRIIVNQGGGVLVRLGCILVSLHLAVGARQHRPALGVVWILFETLSQGRDICFYGLRRHFTGLVGKRRRWRALLRARSSNRFGTSVLIANL